MISADEVRKMQAQAVSAELVQLAATLPNQIAAAESTIKETARQSYRPKQVEVGRFNRDLVQGVHLALSALPQPLKQFIEILQNSGFNVTLVDMPPCYFAVIASW